MICIPKNVNIPSSFCYSKCIQRRDDNGCRQSHQTAAGGQRCGISQSFLRSVERNEKGISVASLSIVCDELGLSLKAFFDTPDTSSPEDDILLRRIEQLTPKQKEALAVFLDTILQ